MSRDEDGAERNTAAVAHPCLTSGAEPANSELDYLRAELATARAAIARLEADNERLRSAQEATGSAPVHRAQRAPTLFHPAEPDASGVDVRSSPDDKIRLFRSPFAGRADVHAQRWEHSTSGKSGWSPVTLDRGGAGSSRRYAPMDDGVLAAHLQGWSRKQGNTVFLDPASHEPWPDQWAFLAGIRRLPAADARTIGDALKVTAGPGSAGLMHPVRSRRPGPPPPPVVTATLEASLAIDRIGLPPALVASLKHLASVHNPEFHQREQLRLSTWNTPRMIRCYEEDLDRLYLPRGLLDDATRVVEQAGSRLEVTDRRPAAPARPFRFTGELSPAQHSALNAGPPI